MNDSCKRIEALIALAVSDDLTANERQQVDNHIATCVGCARLGAELTELHANTAALKQCVVPSELATAPAAFAIRSAVPGLITVTIAALLVASIFIFREDNAEPAHTATTEPAPTVTASHHIVPKIAPPPPPRSALAGLAENPGISTNVIATINTKDPDIVILWMGN